jgi:transcription elongation factor Elf1
MAPCYDGAMTRPRDDLGEALRQHLRCPQCSANPFAGHPFAGATKPLRVVAYRKSSARLACRECGLRFSIDVENFASTIAEQQRPSDAVLEAQARERAAGDPRQYLPALARGRVLADRFVEEQRQAILAPHRRGITVDKPRRGAIRFPKRPESGRKD